MTDAGYYRGTAADQDTRFQDKQKKLLKTLKFSDSLAEPVDMRKVNHYDCRTIGPPSFNVNHPAKALSI